MLTKLSEARTRNLVIFGLPMVFILGGLLTFHLGRIALTLTVLGLLTLGTVLVAWIYRPRWWGSTRVLAISILVFGGLVIAAFADTFWLPWLADLYAGLRAQFPDLPELSLPATVPYWFRLSGLVVAALLFYSVSRLAAQRPVLPAPDTASDSPFPQKDYEALRDDFCRYMQGQLDQYDTELNWSDSDYSTLEAEVEADRHGVRRPRVERDLVDAIRRDKETRAFLLLGDPGSGKSVSLRRLCRRLYQEVPETGIVPVYVNLRDWHGTAEPGDEEIQLFVREYLKRSAGRAGKRFLDTWFEAMLADGRFFFLLDSFDEMPSVLDCDDADQRIKTISHAFDRFFHDLHGCRGVLASRRFRQPRGFRGRRLSIRPFRESQIRAAMHRWLQGQPLDPDNLVRTLFRDRPELVPALRNPFLADLIAHYLIQHQGELPPSHFAIYQDYLETRLTEDATDLRTHGLDQAAVLDAATRIARAMYANPNVGLEVDRRELAALVPMERLDDLIEALRMARIVRVGGIRAQRLAFVHRRFAEFFVVRALLAADDPLPIDSIPEDSRWRDCLALYCGVAPSERVQPIADFCWRYIEAHAHLLDSGDPAQSRPLIHCLRFLRDGFLPRPECLIQFKGPLTDQILSWIASDNPLAAKTASEALGLLDAPSRSKGLQLAFSNSGIWIKESALLACRHLGGLDDVAHKAIRAHVRSIPMVPFLRTYQDLHFGFSLSEDMAAQRSAISLDLASMIALWLLAPSLLVLSFSASIVGLYLFLLVAGNVLAGVYLRGVMEDFQAILKGYILGDGLLSRTVRRAKFLTRRRFPTYPLIDVSAFQYRQNSFDGAFRLALLAILLPLLVVPAIWHLLSDVLQISDLPPALRCIFERAEMSRCAAVGSAAMSVKLSQHWLTIAFLLLIPWEVWRSIVATFLVPSDSLRKSALKSLAMLGSYLALATASIAGIVLLLKGGIFAVVLFYLLMLGPAAMAMPAIFRAIDNAGKDWSALRSIKWPPTMSRPWIHDYCSRLRTESARQRFIETIRLRGLVATDGPAAPTEAHWMTKPVRESLTRLEAYWAGLED